VVARGGCIDILHAGHVDPLLGARRLGDRLVVLLNSDASVRRLKGEGRPINTAADRAAVLRALGCVDEVIVFDEDTPVTALERVRPDVFVKGGDYSSRSLPEAAAMAAWGGEVVVLPYVEGRSTTGLLSEVVRRGAS
jgi:rfaE bifunctional protein nucleotidyltransferase chain/domain